MGAARVLKRVVFATAVAAAHRQSALILVLIDPSEFVAPTLEAGSSVAYITIVNDLEERVGFAALLHGGAIAAGAGGDASSITSSLNSSIQWSTACGGKWTAHVCQPLWLVLVMLHVALEADVINFVL